MTSLERTRAELAEVRAERAKIQAQIAALKAPPAPPVVAKPPPTPAQGLMLKVQSWGEGPWYKNPIWLLGIAGAVALIARRK